MILSLRYMGNGLQGKMSLWEKVLDGTVVAVPCLILSVPEDDVCRVYFSGCAMVIQKYGLLVVAFSFPSSGWRICRFSIVSASAVIHGLCPTPGFCKVPLRFG